MLGNFQFAQCSENGKNVHDYPQRSGRPNRVNTKYTKYRIFSILTNLNNTELNLIGDENKGYPLVGQFFPFLLYLYVRIFSKILKFGEKMKKNFFFCSKKTSRNCFMFSFAL